MAFWSPSSGQNEAGDVAAAVAGALLAEGPSSSTANGASVTFTLTAAGSGNTTTASVAYYIA